MVRQLRLEYEGAIYHITARGNERKKIYHSQRDYTKFKEYLKLSKKRFSCINPCIRVDGESLPSDS